MQSKVAILKDLLAATAIGYMIGDVYIFNLFYL